ncbi:hypothetical protein EJB05_42932 [Eragrostis curvula]|uniref:Uncharacterized protein n=1 Tax=Eragrostis curvula TaxID=38414 RepID=A0A5J9TDN9_9POAL|nr:hypothetical protein EJB05_42932 [Eragrostis curvula]
MEFAIDSADALHHRIHQQQLRGQCMLQLFQQHKQQQVVEDHGTVEDLCSLLATASMATTRSLLAISPFTSKNWLSLLQCGIDSVVLRVLPLVAAADGAGLEPRANARRDEEEGQPVGRARTGEQGEASARRRWGLGGAVA